MSGYKRYDRYKDSGVEWIGEVPEGWEISKIKYETYINKNVLGEHADDDFEIIYIDIGSVNSFGEIRDLQNYQFVNAPSRARRVVKDGDTIVSTVRTYLKAIAFIHKPPKNLICSTGFAVLSPGKKLVPQYLFYLMRSESYVNEIVKRSVGVSYPAVNASDIGNLQCLLPNMQTQQLIVSFLDQKITEFDGLIADKERMIELLQEHRQAIISEAVAKGLNPDVKMKDSGIEWIGEVPEGWEIKKIKYLASVNPNKSEIRHLPPELEVTFIPMEKIIRTGVVDYSITDAIENLISGYTYFKDGDIILAKVTPCFENGNIAVVDGLLNGIGFGTTELHVLRCKSNCYNSFLFYYFQSSIFKSKGVSEMYGVAGLKRIPTNFILNYKLAVPNYRGQEKIANFLDQKIAEIDELVSDIQLQIQKLKEYRQSLISEAVTGKIDVRDYKDN